MTRSPHPVVDEVRAAREAIAKEFDYDIERIARALQARQAKDDARGQHLPLVEGGFPVVCLPPKRPADAQKTG